MNENITDKENYFKLYYGYEVYPDGRFVKNGEILKYQKNGQINLTVKGESKRIQGVRVLYSVFKRGGVPLERNEIIVFIDGNKEHRNIENLDCVSKKEYDKMIGRKNPPRVLTDAEVEEIRNLYELKNEQKLKTGNQTPSISYRKLAKKYGVHFTTIQSVIQGSY